MNFINSPEKNYLYTSTENEDNIQEIMKLTVPLLDEKVVLLLTRKHVDLVALKGLSKKHMQNFLIFHHFDINGAIAKLLELHDWSILPDLVILNLNSFFDVADTVLPFDRVCFCISALFSYMSSLAKRIDVSGGSVGPISLSLLNAHSGVQIQLLIDFYFYKSAAFSELDEIKSAIVN